MNKYKLIIKYYAWVLTRRLGTISSIITTKVKSWSTFFSKPITDVSTALMVQLFDIIQAKNFA